MKSIAKGVTEFYLIDHDDSPAIIDTADAESFTAIKQSVQIARQWGEDDADRDLRLAKEVYRDVEASIRKVVLSRTTARDVQSDVAMLNEVLEVLELVKPYTGEADDDADAISNGAEAGVDVVSEAA